MEIEDTIFQDYLPVNANAMLNRLKTILKENGTNHFGSIKKKDEIIKARKVFWLLLNQMPFNPNYDTSKEWNDLKKVSDTSVLKTGAWLRWGKKPNDEKKKKKPAQKKKPSAKK